MSAAGDRLREASLGSDVTRDTTRSAEELLLPAARRDDEEARCQETYSLIGVPLYTSARQVLLSTFTAPVGWKSTAFHPEVRAVH